MNLFERFKRNGKREFMKYEDGKIVPVHIEEPKNYKEVIYSHENHTDFNIKEAVKETADVSAKKVKGYMTWKLLKVTVSLAVALFFGYTVYDLYQNFVNQPAETVSEETTPTNGGEEDLNATNEIPIEDAPTSTETEEIPLTVDDEDDNVKKPTISSLQQTIELANSISGVIITESNKEIGALNGYYNDKYTLYSLNKTLETSRLEKQETLSTLRESKALFVEEKIQDFYDITEERLNNSIAFSNEISTTFDRSASYESIKSLIVAFSAKDQSLKDKQSGIFIRILDSKKISYTIDKKNEEINYEIK